MCTPRSKARNILAGACLLVAGAAAPAAAFTLVSGSATDKPEVPGLAAPRVVLDCFPPDSLTVRTDTDTTLAGDTSGGTSQVAGYPCRAWAEPGPEVVFRLDVATALQLTVVLRADVDLDLFLLSDCDTDSCLAGENTEFVAELSPGDYYLVVDGYGIPDVASGPFELDVTARPLGIPASVCEPGGAIAVDCAGETITIGGESLFGRPDLVRTYECGGFPRTAGERWYAVTLPPTHEVTVNVRDVFEGFDTCLWVFEACGPDARCVDYVDANVGGSGESITIVNEGVAPIIRYVAVDAVRPPESAGAGTYNIDFQCQSNVAVDGRSFGAVKALYR